MNENQFKVLMKLLFWIAMRMLNAKSAPALDLAAIMADYETLMHPKEDYGEDGEDDYLDS